MSREQPTSRTVLPNVLPKLYHQGATNACGPCALAMAASCLLPDPPSPAATSALLRPYRLPGVGATMPWGLVTCARQLGLRVSADILGTPAELRAALDGGDVVLVLVHPTDFACRWFDLHYRVLVGYEASESGRLVRWLFACSATRRAGAGERGWNLALPPARFQAQWHNALLPRWYVRLGAGL